MIFLGNIVRLILGGIVIALIYYIVGLLMCITIIGIPLAFSYSSWALTPSGPLDVNW